MEIIKCNIKHYEEIKQLMQEALMESPLAFSVDYVELAFNSDMWWHHYIDPFFNNQSGIFFAAIENELPVGIFGATFSTSNRKQHTASLVWLYVKQLHRGKGIANLLVKKVMEECKLLAKEKLTLFVNSSQQLAQNIYLKNGFTHTGTLFKELKIEDKYYDVLIMEKSLAS